MDWANRINAVIDYVEARLQDEICPEEISRIMACPYNVFQRSFVQITGITLGEYVRRRRLTCAAYDVRNTGEKLIDIAMKYGYESSDAFTVAFKRLHDVAPAAVRKGAAELKFHARLHFTLMVKGVSEMNYHVVERDPFTVIGRRRTTPDGGGTWGVAREDGSIGQMMKLETGNPFLGLCFGFGEDGSNDYMVGVEYAGDAVEGLESYTYPWSRWLVFADEGGLDENVLGRTWDRIYGEFLPQSEYKQADLPTVESYLVWDDEKKFCKIEVRIPVA